MDQVWRESVEEKYFKEFCSYSFKVLCWLTVQQLENFGRAYKLVWFRSIHLKGPSSQTGAAGAWEPVGEQITLIGNNGMQIWGVKV